MAAYISGKSSWLRFLVSFLPAAAVPILLSILFSGPRLGSLYDFLLRQRQAPPISREILIIDSSVPGRELVDDILEPGAAASLLYTMTELGGRTLIIQVPILGLSAGGNPGEAEILARFDEEFSLLSRNIRNLFDGIRTGSVAPADSARYVGELVDLSEKGKERLVSALVRRDEEGILGMEKAAAFFGHARRPGDLQVQLIRTSNDGAAPGDASNIPANVNEYSRARPDPDGVLRRIAPVQPGSEHIIYGALKSRFRTTGTEDTGKGKILAALDGPDGKNFIIPLDRDGMLLFEVPHKGEDFRRIGISDFLSYDQADRDLRRLLGDADALGIYQYVNGENNPVFLYDYAVSLREELLQSPVKDEEKKYAWIEARSSYFKNLDDFLYGPSEMKLVEGFEEIIASEPHSPNPMGEAGIAKITALRDSIIRSFVSMRSKYNEVTELRKKLESALDGSFCILGRGSPRPDHRPRPADPAGTGKFAGLLNFPKAAMQRFTAALPYANPTDVEASALLANSILTGRAIKPGSSKYLLIFSLLAVFLTCFFIKSLKPALTLGVGLFLILLAGAGFSLSFVFSALWLDPLVPVAGGVTGLVISFVWALIARIRYWRSFSLAYGPFVSHSCLKNVIHAGKPLPSQSVTVKTAVVAIKNCGLGSGGESPSSFAREVFVYQEKAAEIFRKAGGTVTGTDGDLVTVCFGSPLERVSQNGKRKVSPYEDNIHALAAPAMKAVDVVSGIAGKPEYASWNFGLDLGYCSFAWNALSGYTALGYPVQRARLLSRLASRYRARIVISAAVNESMPDLALKKLDVIKESGQSGEGPFYRLL